MCLVTPVFQAFPVSLANLVTRVSLESQVIPVFQAFPVSQAIAHQVILDIVVFQAILVKMVLS